MDDPFHWMDSWWGKPPLTKESLLAEQNAGDRSDRPCLMGHDISKATKIQGIPMIRYYGAY